MAGTVKTVLPTKETGMASRRFFTGEPFDSRPFASGGGKRKAHSHAAKRAAPHYVTTPVLNTVQEIITTPKGDPETPCRILAVLNQIFPLGNLPDRVSDPFELIAEAFQKWVASFVSPQVLAKLDLSLHVLSEDQWDSESYGEIQDYGTAFQFGLSNFIDLIFPLQQTLETYDKRYPELAKYLLRMLSACPISIGTPENIYEMVSYYCWCDNENEEEVYGERYQEGIDAGDSEEDAHEMALGTILVEYTEFENYVPDWTFERSQRKIDYSGSIPPELQKLKNCYDRWERRKKSRFCIPDCTFPGIIAPMDQDCYDFLCDVVNRIGNDQMQCGGDYFFSTIAWTFAIEQPKQILASLLEMRFVLEYFSVCVDFLLANEKERLNA